MKKVSVHIVTFNSGEYIQACLDAVLRQSYPIEQIVIVDNDSKDQTIEQLEPFAQQITILRNEENLGFAAAHNQAIRQSHCDYYLVLNPDVTLERDYVKHLVECMEQHQDVGSATGQLLLKSEPHLIDSTGLLLTKNRRAFDRGANQPAELWNSSGEVFGVSGAAAFYRKEMVEAVSGYDGQFFDEEFFAYKEDVDVAWRGQLMGWRAYYVANAIAYHERGWKKNSRAQQAIRIRRHSYINRYRLLLKNDRFFSFIRFLPTILLYEVAANGYLLLREPQVLKEWIVFWKTFPVTLQKRRWIRERQQVSAKQIETFFEARNAQ